MSSTLKVDILQDSGGNTILSSDGSGNVTQTRTGITQIDNWRLVSNQNSGTNADVTAGWQRNDGTGFGYIGDGLTESSGIFTLPETGIYQITFKPQFSIAANDTAADFYLSVTTDNSTYSDASLARGGAGSTAVGQSVTANFFFDVTDTTQCKFKFRTASFSTGTQLIGNTSHNRTSFHVIRLGDT